jgi:hypothetical protein
LTASRPVTQIDRDTPGDTRRNPQNLAFTARTRQVAILQRRPRPLPVDRRYRLAAEATAELDMNQEILSNQPGPVADQQLDSRLTGQQTRRPRPKRDGQIIEARRALFKSPT